MFCLPQGTFLQNRSPISESINLRHATSEVTQLVRILLLFRILQFIYKLNAFIFICHLLIPLRKTPHTTIYMLSAWLARSLFSSSGPWDITKQLYSGDKISRPCDHNNHMVIVYYSPNMATQSIFNHQHPPSLVSIPGSPDVNGKWCVLLGGAHHARALL